MKLEDTGKTVVLVRLQTMHVSDDEANTRERHVVESWPTALRMAVEWCPEDNPRIVTLRSGDPTAIVGSEQGPERATVREMAVQEHISRV